MLAGNETGKNGTIILIKLRSRNVTETNTMAEKQGIGKGLSEEYVVRDRIVIIAEM